MISTTSAKFWHAQCNGIQKAGRANLQHFAAAGVPPKLKEGAWQTALLIPNSPVDLQPNGYGDNDQVIFSERPFRTQSSLWDKSRLSENFSPNVAI
jgi:hypothetical protein